MKMNFLQSPIFWIVLVVVGIAVAFVVVKNRDRAPWGFKEVVKVAAFTKKYVLEATSSRDADDEAQILRELGGKTHPAVLSLLRDASLYDRLVRPTGKNVLPEAPLNRACDLLGDAPPAEAVEALAPFLNDPADGIRKDAVLAIAKTGAPTIVPFVRQAFSDKDDYVRSYALMGLDWALKRDGLSETARRELFADVQGLLRSGRNDKAAEILYQLDSARAVEAFLSPEVFTAESPGLHYVLAVLANAAVPVPRDRLLALIQALEQREMKYPTTYALGAALLLLGQRQQPEDRELLRSRTVHAQERIAEGASAGLLASYGLTDFERRIWDAEEKSGYASLTEPQRYYSAVLACNGEINNGGISQYFVNSSGDQWRDALAGFRAMGFTERAAILAEAAAKFGKTGPSADREKRQEQLSKLYKQNDEIFDALESRYYKSAEVIGVYTARYVLEHPEAFR